MTSYMEVFLPTRGGGRKINCPLNPSNGWNNMSAKPPEEGPTRISPGSIITTGVENEIRDTENKISDTAQEIRDIGNENQKY